MGRILLGLNPGIVPLLMCLFLLAVYAGTRAAYERQRWIWFSFFFRSWMLMAIIRVIVVFGAVWGLEGRTL